MVLDTINESDELIFKNTHRNNKKYTLEASDPTAPDEFYFIHMEPKNQNPSRLWLRRQRMRNALLCNHHKSVQRLGKLIYK